MSTVIQLQSASKTYTVDKRAITVLQPTDLTVERGEFIAVTGPSGSGKSTLLNLITGIDHPTGGMVIVDGQNFGGLSESKLALLSPKKVIGSAVQKRSKPFLALSVIEAIAREDSPGIPAVLQTMIKTCIGLARSAPSRMA